MALLLDDAMPPERLGALLRSARKRRGMSRKHLHVSTITHWEFQISHDYFFGASMRYTMIKFSLSGLNEGFPWPHGHPKLRES